MSRIGKLPIPVPAGVTVKVDGQSVEVSGKLGALSRDVNPSITVRYDDSSKSIVVDRSADTRPQRALHGLNRALIANMVKGVSDGFDKAMEVHGTGYNAAVQGSKLVLRVGYSQPREVAIPQGLSVEVKQPANPAQFTIRGADKQAVGEFAAEIRRIRPPEPYKGKGIRYADEVVRRKAGKAFTSGE